MSDLLDFIAAPSAPVVHAPDAEEAMVADTVRDSVPLLCDEGYDIDYLECAGAGHAEGAVLSLPYQLEWVADRLAGVPLDEDEVCEVEAPIDCEQFLDLE